MSVRQCSRLGCSFHIWHQILSVVPEEMQTLANSLSPFLCENTLQEDSKRQQREMNCTQSVTMLYNWIHQSNNVHQDILYSNSSLCCVVGNYGSLRETDCTWHVLSNSNNKWLSFSISTCSVDYVQFGNVIKIGYFGSYLKQYQQLKEIRQKVLLKILIVSFV